MLKPKFYTLWEKVIMDNIAIYDEKFNYIETWLFFF